MKRLLIALTGVSAMLLGSCAQEIGGDNGKVDPIGPNTLRLTVGVEDRQGHSANGSTRAVTATTDEKTINDLYLLFFEPSADKNGQFVDYVKTKIGEGNEIPYGGGFRASIDMSDTQLDVKAAYNILAIANIENITSDAVRYLGGDADDSDEAETNTAVWMQQWSGKTQKQVIAEAQAITASGRVQSDQLLMSGMTSKPANDFTTDVTLLRNQIRFDVVNKAEGYEMFAVSLHNVYGASKIWNDGSIEGALDYSQAVSRIRNYDDYDVNDLVFEPIIEGGFNKIGEKMESKFYVFENTVAQPAQNDAYTTCIIVGLRDSEGDHYFRINILPENQAQILYRNHAYVLTVNSVIGEGAANVNEAYRDADAPELNYIINQWNEDEVGVSDQDGKSMLSSPYKTVNLELSTGKIRGREERGLPDREFNITTVTSLPAGSFTPIEIIGTPKFYLNGKDPYPYNAGGGQAGMYITLNTQNAREPKLVIAPQTATIGQTVHIVPTDGAPYDHTLTAADKITGQITLGYAGLRITIDVVQTDITPPVLNVYPPNGGIGTFAPFADIVSGTIRVEASGPWKAKILAETGAPFAFIDADGTPLPTQIITRDPSASGYSNELTVKTTSVNTDPNKARLAFVVVTLDADPTNYARVVKLTQAQKADIAIDPSSATVTFDGTYDPAGATAPNGDGLNGNLAAVPNNNRTTFNVKPGTSGDEIQGVTQNEWEYRIEALVPNTNPALPGDWTTVYWEFERTSSDNGYPAHGLGWVGGMDNYHWFTVTTNHPLPANLSDLTAPNTFSVDVLGKNSSGTTRNARIVVFPKGTNPDGSAAAKDYINLVQQSSGMALSPSNVPAVAKTGGVTPEVTVDSDASLRWKIESIVPNYTVTGRSGVNAAVNHTIEVLNGNTVIASVNGAESPDITAATYSVSETFRVRFPKIYYPNRQIGMSVKLTIKLYEANGITPTELSKEITFTQSALTSPGFYPYAPQTAGYGNIYGGSYNHRYLIWLRANQSAAPTTSMTVNSNYMHMNSYALSAGYDWASIKTFRAQRDGLLIVDVDEDVDQTPVTMLNNTNSVLSALDYTIGITTNGIGGHQLPIMTDNNDTKVYQMIVKGLGGGLSDIESHYNSNINANGFNPVNGMYVDDVATYVSQRPVSAVGLLKKWGQVLMTVDPKNNIIYQGESQIFDTVNGDMFLTNLMKYIKNAAMWGSAFTDLMVEDDQNTVAEEKAGITTPIPNSHPAPWDAAWGSNGGIQ